MLRLATTPRWISSTVRTERCKQIKSIFKSKQAPMSSRRHLCSQDRNWGLIKAVALGAAVAAGATCFLEENVTQAAAADEAGAPKKARGDSKQYPALTIDNIDEFSSVIIGGGTAGCTVAYFLAKWLEDNNLPGTVLLIDRGEDFTPQNGPDPKISGWWNNWGGFGEAHMTVRQDGSHHPVPATDHRGLGGCGTHDTRITFKLAPPQLKRMADHMGWTTEQLDTFYQAALNIMPLSRALPRTQEEGDSPYFTKVLDALHDDDNKCKGGLGSSTRAANDEFEAENLPNCAAEVSMALYGSTENSLRWTSAYLVHEDVRPKNLKVLVNARVDRVLFAVDDGPDDGSVGIGSNRNIQAKSVLVENDLGQKCEIKLGSGGSNGSGSGGDVVITSGTIGAPGVLQRSGIGPAQTLKDLGIEVLVDNPEVGHGVDHHEIGVLYEWLEQHNDPQTGRVPSGGPTGWPLVVYADTSQEYDSGTQEVDKDHKNSFMQAHAGAGYAEPYADDFTFVMTPNCVQPDPAKGFRAYLTSTKPFDTMHVVHDEQLLDMQALARGVRKSIKLCEVLKESGLCGNRVSPPLEIDINSMSQLTAWCRENHWTVFHWCSSCRAGLNGTVADERFRVKRGLPIAERGIEGEAVIGAIDSSSGSSKSSSSSGDSSGGVSRICGSAGHEVISNLYVGSAACLPEIPEGNPHLTVTAFSVALAQELLQSHSCRQGRCLLHAQEEIVKARADVRQSCTGHAVIRREGEEVPNRRELAMKHSTQWETVHAEKEQ